MCPRADKSLLAQHQVCSFKGGRRDGNVWGGTKVQKHLWVSQCVWDSQRTVGEVNSSDVSTGGTRAEFPSRPGDSCLGFRVRGPLNQEPVWRESNREVRKTLLGARGSRHGKSHLLHLQIRVCYSFAREISTPQSHCFVDRCFRFLALWFILQGGDETLLQSRGI